MLPTEVNTTQTGKAVLAAFRRSDAGKTIRKPQSVFEHGHWWIVDNESGGQWSVVDAEGPNTLWGFGFECVTEPDEAQ